jgi:hypothetical protein
MYKNNNNYFVFLIDFQKKENIFLQSWDCASLIYSSTTNKMQHYTVVFIAIIALHVWGGSSAHHQELKTRVVVELFLLLTAI